MELIWTGLLEALRMIISADSEVFQITWLTVQVCIFSTFISTVLGVPIGMLLAFKHFAGKKIILLVSHAGMGLPPVVAGLWVTMFLWRSGPFGEWQWLFTVNAIVIAQIIVSLPILISLSYSAFKKIDDGTRLQIKALAPTKPQSLLLYLKQAQFGLCAAIMAGLGRVLAEVGAAMMVGGNLQGQTRILTTAMVMEVSRGNFHIALALSFILMAIAFMLTFILLRFQQKDVTT
ncbi:tungstate transporter permease [Salipaludibacillus keqinensis]|uniref:Tungstate transporter permease n=1 Tax=Salipaludibacillus keqinensis TaxID=2045207 RepID=A0A323TK81_9BACI|nr:ABC transporter permease [Salipaludibacillus keqinensis]PYZ94067.1 tungstate transporter permease [Salipaludibacillus keqinensis]